MQQADAITDLPRARANVASPPPPPGGPTSEPSLAAQERREANHARGDGFAAGLGGSGQGGAGIGTGHARMARPTPPRDPMAPALDEFGDLGLGLRGRRAPPERQQGIPGVSVASVSTTGGLGEAEAHRALRARLPAVRACYNRGLQSDRQLTGAAALRLDVDATGEIVAVADTGSAMSDRAVLDCTTRELRAIRFPAPAKSATVSVRLAFRPTVGDDGTSGPAHGAQPYEGKFADVMEAVSRGDGKAALERAEAWRKTEPGDVLALVALGEAYETKGDKAQAARAYGSIVDLFSFRADSRRFAGERLERLKLPIAGSLAIDTFGKAEEQRPDHPASHRLFAFALLRAGQYEKAFEVAKAGAKRTYPSGRFAGVDQILREDLGLVAAAWIRAEPGRKKEIENRLREAGGTPENGPSLRFVLNWETDANDVDFHIRDGRGGHAYYSSPALPSGGRLYADVTTGYGPECFTIRAPEGTRAYPYTIEAHYFAKGPMGYGMGKLEVIDHDGQGKLTFDERPFVVMVNQAFVDLGTVERDFARK